MSEDPDRVDIVVNDEAVSCPRGATLLSVLLQNDFLVETACGGRGTCHLCRVTIVQGRETLPVANTIEKKALGNVLLAMGMRLSCQIQVATPFTVKLPKFETRSERRERLRSRKEKKNP